MPQAESGLALMFLSQGMDTSLIVTVSFQCLPLLAGSEPTRLSSIKESTLTPVAKSRHSINVC